MKWGGVAGDKQKQVPQEATTESKTTQKQSTTHANQQSHDNKTKHTQEKEYTTKYEQRPPQPKHIQNKGGKGREESCGNLAEKMILT